MKNNSNPLNPRVIAYLRVSTDKQSNDNQKFKILEYAQKNNITINEFIYVDLSSTTKEAKEKVLSVIDMLKEGDTLITTELSRLGRKAEDLINNRYTLRDKKVNVIFTNQDFLNTNGNKALDDMIFNIFSAFAQVERENTADRTIQALKAKKAQYKEDNNGKELQLGHLKDFLKSKYDDYEKAIYDFKEVNKQSFPKICSMLDPHEKLGFKAQSMRNFFNARYELEPTFQTYRPKKKYKKIYDEKKKSLIL